MITKEEKIKIFEDTVLGLRKKFISDKEWSDIQELEDDRLAEKYRKLPLAWKCLLEFTLWHHHSNSSKEFA